MLSPSVRLQGALGTLMERLALRLDVEQPRESAFPTEHLPVLEQVLDELEQERVIGQAPDRRFLGDAAMSEVVGLGPLDRLLTNRAVREVVVDGPARILADTGYRSESNLRMLEERGIDGYVAMGREGAGSKQIGTDKVATRRMARKLQTKRGRKYYAKRKHIGEPPFGWIKHVMGFERFSMRGLRKVGAEWNLVTLAANLRRLNGRMVWA